MPKVFQKDGRLIKSMVRKLDNLQSVFGVPPVLEVNIAAKWIEPEFATIWENVLYFKHNVLKPKMFEKNGCPYLSRPLQAKYAHRSVILE